MKILVIDDHILFREGLKFLLTELLASAAVLEENNCEDALCIVEKKSIDLILLDLYLPGESGLNALGKIKANFPCSRVVILSGENSPEIIRESIEMGAFGFIPKTSTPAVLNAALGLILSGGIYLPPQALYDVQANIALETKKMHSLPILGMSTRQLEVLLLAVEGKANKAIARQLNLSEGTVKAHLSSTFKVLGVQNRTEAGALVTKLGLKKHMPKLNNRSESLW